MSNRIISELINLVRQSAIKILLVQLFCVFAGYIFAQNCVKFDGNPVTPNLDT